jgi:probable rRNA maturation factor
MSSDGNLLLVRSVPAHLKLGAGDKQELKHFIRRVQEALGSASGVTCLITNDQELRRLNRIFLEKDYPTDVLSFPPPAGSAEPGELAISIERAEAQAELHGHPVTEELRVLILHGLLHLSGMDHERDHGEMARTERKLRKELGLSNGLIARARR